MRYRKFFHAVLSVESYCAHAAAVRSPEHGRSSNQTPVKKLAGQTLKSPFGVFLYFHGCTYTCRPGFTTMLPSSRPDGPERCVRQYMHIIVCIQKSASLALVDFDLVILINKKFFISPVNLISVILLTY